MILLQTSSKSMIWLSDDLVLQRHLGRSRFSLTGESSNSVAMGRVFGWRGQSAPAGQEPTETTSLRLEATCEQVRGRFGGRVPPPLQAHSRSAVRDPSAAER